MSADRPFGLEAFLPYRLNVAAGMVSQAMVEACLAPAGVSLPQWRVLSRLGADGPTLQASFINRTGMDKIAISRAVNALAEQGLVSSTIGLRDRRARLLALTPAGRTIYRGLAKRALALEARLAEAAGEKDVAGLMRRLRRLEDAALALRRETPADAKRSSRRAAQS